MIRTRRRVLLLTAGVAIVALAVGLVAGQLIRSPADAASRIDAPEASAITVPVELRVLETEVRTRGDAAFAGSVEVELELGGLETPPVVTGHVPERGDEIAEGEPLLEVVGRPILALEGELPMYRSLSPGMSGPDVEQLKATLRQLGLNPGGDNDRYDGFTAQAVAELFRRAGYEPPQPDEAAAAEVDAAEDAVELAEDELAGAESALEQAEDGPEESLVTEARKQVEQAKENLSELRDELSEAQFRAGTPLPISEVYYLRSLPRFVDSVAVSRGDLAEGAVMSVSGADLRVTLSSVNEADVAVLSEGLDAILDLPTGEATGTVTNVDVADGRVVIKPPELTTDEIDALLEVGNILVRIPVGSTEGEVLAVPLAAVSAGPGGESRVEVHREGAAATELVVVEVGLVAEGYAEVTPVDGDLADGDLVVVGESADQAES